MELLRRCDIHVTSFTVKKYETLIEFLSMKHSNPIGQHLIPLGRMGQIEGRYYRYQLRRA
jgi:hypothetical protein